MSAKVVKNKNGTYKVKTPNGTRAKSTTKKKAESQVRLLNAIDHGFTPGQRKVKKLVK